MDRFNAKLDELVQGKNPDISGEDAELLELAAMLAQADFSTESRVRDPLRAKLIPRGKPTREVKIMTLLQSKRTLSAIAAALLVVMFLTVPPLRTMAQDVFRMLFVREQTRAEVLDGQEAPATENNDFQPFGVESIEALTAQAGFPPFTAGYIPEGYTLTSRFAPQTGENSEVVTDYTGAGEDVLHISQVRYDPTWAAPQWAVGDAAPRPVTVRGVSATYIEQAPIGARRVNGRFESYGVNILTWEQDGFRFILQSAKLDLTELAKIAESMQ